MVTAMADTLLIKILFHSVGDAEDFDRTFY